MDRPEGRIDGCIVTRGAEWSGRPCILCEAEVGRECATYAQRRRLRDELAPSSPGAIIVFTDSAHSRYVWTWTEAAGPPPARRYLEYSLPGRETGLLTALRSTKTDAADVAPFAAGARRVEQAIVGYLGLRVGAPGAAGIADLVAWTQARDEIAPVRRLWASLARIRVIDPCCDDSGPPVRAAALLELAYLAALDRMRSWVDDRAHAREKGRADRDAEIRTLVDLASDARRNRTPEVFVRRLVVQRNIFALGEDRRSVQRCREDLLEFAERLDGRLRHLDSNVRQAVPSPLVAAGRRRYGKRGREDLAFRTLRGVPVSSGLAEAAETLRYAWVAAADARLNATAPVSELLAAAGELERRRLVLSRELARILPRYLDRAEDTFFPYTHFPAFTTRDDVWICCREV